MLFSTFLGMERIFYKSDEVDAYTGYPIYVFDTSYLPSTSQIDYDLFIPTMTKSLPNQPYVLVMFSCGLNKINWIWGVKFLKAFLSPDYESRDNIKNLTRVISVHESWFVKSISQILTNISFSRQTLARLSLLFDSKTSHNNILTSCDSLSELSYYVDITKLKISLNIYKHDANSTLSPKIDFECPINNILTASTRFSRVTDPVFYHHFYQIFRIVDTYGPNVELIFHRPGNRLGTEILVLCITRNQLIWINDWDLNCIASCFKKLLLDVSGPMIPVSKITLPMNDLLNYTLEVLNMMMIEEETNALIFQIMDLCYRIVENADVTHHTCLSISKSMCHALTHEVLSTQNKDRITIGTRFIKNVITHWRLIYPLYQQRFKTVEQIVNGESLLNAAIDELYNMSHEITMKEEDSGDENESSGPPELFDTKAILADFSEIAIDDATPPLAEPRVAVGRTTEVLASLQNANQGALREPKSSVSRPGGATKRDAREVVTAEVAEEDDKAKNETEANIYHQDEVPQVRHGVIQTRKASPEQEEVETKRQIASGEKQQHLETQLREEKRTDKPEGAKSSGLNNTQLQFPPQKYKFEKLMSLEKGKVAPPAEPKPVFKKPVIRGRKVGQLTKLFEERTQAMEIIRTI